MNSKSLFSSNLKNSRSFTYALGEVELDAPQSSCELELSRLGRMMNHRFAELTYKYEELTRKHKALKKKYRSVVSKVKRGKLASPVSTSNRADACVGPDISLELKLPVSQKELKIYSDIERIFAGLMDLKLEYTMEITLEKETGIDRSFYINTINEASRELAGHITGLVDR